MAALLTYIGAVLGSLFVLAAFFSKGAPQEAALCAYALAFTMIPYAVFRVGQIRREEARRTGYELKVMKLLEGIREASEQQSLQTVADR